MGNDLNCCRIIFGEADGLPGLTVDKYNNILDKLKNLNLIIEQNNNIALTQRGRELSNTVFIEFID